MVSPKCSNMYVYTLIAIKTIDIIICKYWIYITTDSKKYLQPILIQQDSHLIMFLLLESSKSSFSTFRTRSDTIQVK